MPAPHPQQQSTKVLRELDIVFAMLAVCPLGKGWLDHLAALQNYGFAVRAGGLVPLAAIQLQGVVPHAGKT